MSYYPPYKSSSNNIKVELDLSNYATKDGVKKVEDKVNENKKEIIFVRGFFLYEYHSDLVYDCKLNLIKTYFYGILKWKPKNIYDPLNKNAINSVQNIKLISPNIKNDGKGLHVFFSDNYFQQDIIAIPNNVINIYCVYELDPIDFSRNNEFTIQNALFGAIEITKNANTSQIQRIKVKEKLCIGNLSDQWTTRYWFFLYEYRDLVYDCKLNLIKT